MRLQCTLCWYEGHQRKPLVEVVAIVEGPGPICFLHAVDYFDNKLDRETDWTSMLKDLPHNWV